MDAKAIEAALTQIEQGISAVRAELSKESGAGAPAAPGAPGEMATPAAGGGGAGPAGGGLAAFLGR